MEDHDAKRDAVGDQKSGLGAADLKRHESLGTSRFEKLFRRIGLSIALILLVVFVIEMVIILRR
ncbi:MAG: hypothetical protein ABSE62_06630 [Chthoniobacteraceae bacterium]|jgi:hypothetical protein